MGDEPLSRVVAEGESLLDDPGLEGGRDRPLVSLLRLLVGTGRSRLGDLQAAERHLAAVADVEPSEQSSGLVVRARSQLALAQLVGGREHAINRLTPHASTAPHRPDFRAAGLEIAQHLAALQRLAEPDRRGAADLPPVRESLEEDVCGDPLAFGLLQVVRSRLLLAEGRAAEAVRALQGGLATSTIPVPLQPTVLLEEAMQALLSGDRETLRVAAERLRALGLTGEAALAEAFRADLSDDLARSASLFADAAHESSCQQPPAVAIALASRAQVLDALGRRAEAADALLEAARRSELRRNLVPFLGWSRHGRPMAGLLQELAQRHPTTWCRELAEAATLLTAMTTLAGPMTATPQEQAQVVSGATYVSLSPRERDVLHELARGSTYADIASNLYLSENTVKTHVSSVYSKLAVNRRSDALAVARTHHLL
jgi:DNA-binding CsgD family transcriptional regulator